jgi:hypothetical protein
MPKAISEHEIRVRQVTHYQPTWTEGAPGQSGTFTIQLILDQGAAEYVIRATAEDMDVLFEMLDRGENVYFDLERKVLMFGTRSV